MGCYSQMPRQLSRESFPWLCRWIQLCLVGFLAFGLVACQHPSALPNELVRQALALQIDQTNALLTQQLKASGLAAPLVDIKRVVVLMETPLMIEQLPGFHVKGVYDAVVDLPDRQLTQRQQTFALYLQRQAEGKTWRLAFPIPQPDGSFVWNTQWIEEYHH